jgi:hypothetical protein
MQDYDANVLTTLDLQDNPTQLATCAIDNLAVSRDIWPFEVDER